MIEQKAWGQVRHLFVSEVTAISYLETKSNGYCSIHRHLDRFNQFTVIRGIIDVVVFGGDQTQPRGKGYEHRITPGQSVIIPAKVWHQFVVRSAGIVIETYWTENGCPVRSDDIERFVEGGSNYDTFVSPV